SRRWPTTENQRSRRHIERSGRYAFQQLRGGPGMIRFLGDLAARIRRRSQSRGRRVLDPLVLLEREAPGPPPYFRGASKPYTRWWWLAGPFRREDIRLQLAWLRSNGFGGVELAWLRPSWMGDAEPGIDWLGPEWSDLVAFTKREADRLRLGFDFTVGSCWPFW